MFEDLIYLFFSFPARCDRYNHSEVDTDEAAEPPEPAEEAGLFAAFSSTSPQWRRHYHHSCVEHDSRVSTTKLQQHRRLIYTNIFTFELRYINKVSTSQYHPA